MGLWEQHLCGWVCSRRGQREGVGLAGAVTRASVHSPTDRALELGWPLKLPHGDKVAGPRCPCVYEESWVAAYSQTGCNPRARQYSSAKGSLGEALKCESQHPLFPASGRVSPWVPKQVSSTLIQQCVFQSIIVVTEYWVEGSLCNRGVNHVKHPHNIFLKCHSFLLP